MSKTMNYECINSLNCEYAGCSSNNANLQNDQGCYICAMLVFKTINAMYIENVLQPSLQFLVSDVPITMGIQ